jgi:integrase
MGLKWSDVDWAGKRITIQRSLKWPLSSDWYTTPPKTAKSIRTIALTDALVRALEDHRLRQLEARMTAGPSWTDHKFIFTDVTGEPLRFEGMRRVYKAICKVAGMPETFQLKTSRHSCASGLLNDGVPLKMVSDRLGHSSIRVTADFYGVTEEERAREVSERAGRLFGIGKK